MYLINNFLGRKLEEDTVLHEVDQGWKLIQRFYTPVEYLRGYAFGCVESTLNKLCIPSSISKTNSTPSSEHWYRWSRIVLTVAEINKILFKFGYSFWVGFRVSVTIMDYLLIYLICAELWHSHSWWKKVPETCVPLILV